jgi:mannose-6-phosphate isomerase-like protein (cupin superfamily)
MAGAIKLNKASAEHYVWGDRCDGWHLVKQPGLSVIHERMPPGSKEVRHFHRVARQCFFVLSGELTIELAGVLHKLTIHDALEIEPGEPHQVINSSSGDVEFLVVSQPTTRGDRTDLAD